MICIDAKWIPAIDEYAVQREKITMRTLMGNAGNFIADTVSADAPIGSRFLIFCGSGNNGGDGYAAALALWENGYKAYCVDVTGKDMTSDAARYYYCRYRESVGFPLSDLDITSEMLEEYAGSTYAFVEAVFGSGFRAEGLPERVFDIIDDLNRLRGPKKIAVDMPAGVCGSTGKVVPGAFKAEMTVSLTLPKRGAFLYPGCRYCGKIVSDAIGIDLSKVVKNFGLRDIAMDDAEARMMLPPRAPDANKGSCGRLAMVVGSEKYPGAALLASYAALRSGCGYTKLYAPASVTSLAVARTPSLIAVPTGRESCGDILKKAEADADILLIGCGLGQSEQLRDALYASFMREGCPLVLDADALNSLALSPEETEKRFQTAKRKILLLPHPKEFSRLAGISVEDLQNNRYDRAVAYAVKCGVVLLLKGMATVIALPNGSVIINTSGSDALAKAGSGDTLAGIIGALAAEGIDLEKAAALGAYIHGKAGENLAEIYSRYGVMPEDIPGETARILAELS